jgi:hypothetical protein
MGLIKMAAILFADYGHVVVDLLMHSSLEKQTEH